MSNRGRWRVETRIADMVGDGGMTLISVWSTAWGSETAQFISRGRSDQDIPYTSCGRSVEDVPSISHHSNVTV